MTLESRLVNLAAAGRRLVEQNLTLGLNGSISLRWQDLCYISPAGARLERLSAADFVPLHIVNQNTWQLPRASAEYALHLASYRARADAATVFRLDPPNCVALGCAGLSLPAITPDLYWAVGPEVPLLPYTTPTTAALVDAVSQALAASDAVLLGNQGLLLIASSTDDAVMHTLLVEEAARVVLLAHAAAGACSFLTTEAIEELERVTGRYHPLRQPGRRQATL